MSDPNPNTMMAGWYHDPSGADALRWWDGAAWTTQQRPKQVLGTWTMPSEYSTVAMAPAGQPLAITASASPYPEAPAQPEPFSQLAPQPEPYVQPAPQPDPYAQLAPQPDPYAQLAPQPDPFDQLLSQPDPVAPYGSAPAGGAPTPVAASGPHRSAQTVGVWLLAVFPLLAIPISGFAYQGIEFLLTELDLPVPGIVLTGVPVAIIVGWVFAGFDIRGLRKAGYRPPSILWMLLLPPIAYFIARSVKLRRDRGKTWPAGIVLGISITIAGAFFVVMFSVIFALLGSLGLLPPGFGQQVSPDPFASSVQDPRTIYGVGQIAEQDNVLGPLPESADPYPTRVENLIATSYLFPVDGSLGIVDCSAAVDLVVAGSTFPCQVVDLDTSDGFDDTANISVTLDADEALSYSVL